MSIEAMKQALEALEQYSGVNQRACDAEESLRQAIEQAEKNEMKDWEAIAADRAMTIAMLKQRDWVDLTDEEKAEILESVGYSQFMSVDEFARLVQYATETKLREKNHEPRKQYKDLCGND